MKVMNPRLVRAARRLDFVWRLLARLSTPHHAPDNSPVASILVVDLHLVGDMVMLIPLISSLRERHPSAKISLLAGPWCAAILTGIPAVDEVITYVAPWVKRQRLLSAIIGYCRIACRLRATRWDIGIDVRGDIRQILLLYLAGCRQRVGFDFTGGGALLTEVVPDDGELRHVLDHHQRIAACLGAWGGQDFIPALSLTSDEKRDAARIAPFIGFHLGASLPLRRLPPREAAALVSLHDCPDQHLVFFSSPDMEDYTAEVLSLLPAPLARRLEVWRGDLRGFIVKASRARRMFTMDSGPAHIAAALALDTVVFFGPNLPRYTGPRGQRVRFVEDTTVPCRPCDQHTCTNVVYQACMLGLVDTWRQHPEDDDRRSRTGPPDAGAWPTAQD